MGEYEAEVARLMAAGWTPEQGIPESLLKFAGGGGPEGTPGATGANAVGTPENPMELSTMTVTGTPPAAGGAPQAGSQSGPPGVFEGMTDQQADQFAGMGDLDRQMQVAEGLRGTADAEGQTVNNGRTFVAANPLEHAVVGAKRWKGAKDAKRLGGEQTKGRRSFVDLLRNKGKTPLKDTLMDGPGEDEFDFMAEETTRYA